MTSDYHQIDIVTYGHTYWAIHACTHPSIHTLHPVHALHTVQALSCIICITYVPYITCSTCIKNYVHYMYTYISAYIIITYIIAPLRTSLHTSSHTSLHYIKLLHYVGLHCIKKTHVIYCYILYIYLYKISRRHDVTPELTMQNFQIKNIYIYSIQPFLLPGDSAWKAQH